MDEWSKDAAFSLATERSMGLNPFGTIFPQSCQTTIPVKWSFRRDPLHAWPVSSIAIEGNEMWKLAKSERIDSEIVGGSGG
jgi:hypothetical protein